MIALFAKGHFSADRNIEPAHFSAPTAMFGDAIALSAERRLNALLRLHDVVVSGRLRCRHIKDVVQIHASRDPAIVT